MTKLQAVFFDLGDTLVDLGEGLPGYAGRLTVRAARVYDTLAAAGLALPERDRFCTSLAEETEAFYQQAVAEQRGVDIHDALRSLLPQMGFALGDGLVAACGDAYYGGPPDSAPLRMGARELLAGLAAGGLRLGVISNTLQPGRVMDASLTRRGLIDLFATRTYSSEIRVAKPHPAIFRAALAAMQVPAEGAVHVGDRLGADVRGAQGVGMKAVLIRVAHRVEEEPGIAPDATITDLQELPGVLAELFESGSSRRSGRVTR